MSMSNEQVLYSCASRVATITLNRPENRNSMTPEVMAAFRETVARAAADRIRRDAVVRNRQNATLGFGVVDRVFE